MESNSQLLSSVINNQFLVNAEVERIDYSFTHFTLIDINSQMKIISLKIYTESQQILD